MAVKKTIAIAGAAGRIGNAIANRLVHEDFRLLLMGEENDQLSEVVNKIKTEASNAEVEAIECIKEGCWEADIIILAVPFDEQKEVAKKIKEVATQKIVVSISNAENSTRAQEELKQILPHSVIVTVCFNTRPGNASLMVDDKDAIEVFINMVKKGEFNPEFTTVTTG